MAWNEHDPEPMVDQLDDDQLIARVRENPELFDVLYNRYFQRIYRYCLKRTNDVQQAEDLCSEVFITLYRKLDLYKGGHLAGWLFRIAHNIVIDHYRKQKQVIALDSVQLRGDSQMAQSIANQMLVEEMLSELSESERELITLRLDAGLSAPEIAEITGKSASAIRVQIYRLLKRLRDRYTGMIGDER